MKKVFGSCPINPHEILMKWRKRKVSNFEILAKADGKANLIYGDNRKELTLKKGQKISVAW